MPLAFVLGCSHPTPAPRPTDPGAPLVSTARSVPEVPTALVPSKPKRLVFLGDVDLDRTLRIEGLLVGGISALAYRAQDDTWIALSDAHLAHTPSRRYDFKVTMDPFSVSPGGVVLLSGPFEAGAEDPEGLALLPDSLLVCSEGDGKRSPALAPSIQRFDPSGTYLGAIPLPAIVESARANRALEGLSASPSGRRFVAANEQALTLDGPSPSPELGTTVRLMMFETASMDSGPISTFAYRTDPVPPPSRPGRVTTAEVGVSALTMLDDHNVWVMERAGVEVEGEFTNRIRIYQVDLQSGIAITNEPMPAQASVPLLEKTEVADLDAIVAQLHTPKLDNFEAMALGPRLPDGRRTLLIASDDNFSARQRSVWIAFGIDE